MRRITDLDAFLARLGEPLADVAAQDLDFPSLDWSSIDVRGAVFLGCRFATLEDEVLVRHRGALVFPRFESLPYDPYRTSLYTPAELMDGFDGSPDTTADFRIWRHFEEQGRHAPGIREAIAQRAHDHAIDDALHDFLGAGSKVVGVMGGHGASRADSVYGRVARTALLLGRDGFLVASGGGPGMMEAANLGAYLSKWDETALGDALGMLAAAPRYEDYGAYVDAARAVLERFPGGRTNLAVPTWFYGHEPSNLFSTHVAKYFSNSIREDGLLAIATSGIVFAPGSAGTAQEVFQDAAQNHYRTFTVQSPMVFLGVEHWQERTGIYTALRNQSAGRDYDSLIRIYDSAEDVAAFISSHG